MKMTFSFSQIFLGVAICYLAYTLMTFTKEIPKLILAVDSSTPHISGIINEVEQVRTEVAKVRKLIDKQLPVVLKQTENALPLVEQGLAQSDIYAKQFPKLWLHLEKIESQIAQLQQRLPSVLERIDAVVETTNTTTKELAQWRPHSTEYLTAIENSRQDIPQYLTRAEAIITDAKTIGKETSSGLVSGFIKGVISLPFDVVSGLTGIIDAKSLSAKYLTTQDIAMMQEQVVLLLADNKKQHVFWQNSDSGNRGKITKKPKFVKNGLSCHKLVLINHFESQQETLTKVMCQDKYDLWQVM